MASITASEEDAVVAGVYSFVDRMAQPLQESLGPIFTDQRRYFDDHGREAVEVTDARRAVRVASAEAGYYTMFTPAELGGSALGNRLYFRCIEALGERYGPGQPAEPLAGEVIANWFTGPGPIWTHASPELRAAVLPDLVGGRTHGCFGLSEANAGSDVWSMRTTAVRDGDQWILNGAKEWISWSSDADFLLVFAVTDPDARAARRGGITCFYVPTSALGYHYDSNIGIFGEVGGREGSISFHDVRVPDTHRIGAEGAGLSMAFLTVNQTRLWMCARSCGEAKWALQQALQYSKVRETFGHPIAEYQSIQNMLADSLVEIYAARSMGLDCAAKADVGCDVRTESAMTKLYSLSMAMRVFDRAMQIHGGIGIANSSRLFDGWKIARMGRITEGADEIMRRTIAVQLLRRGSLPI